MAELIKANGETTTVKPKNGQRFTLEELQILVKGYIEVFSCKDGRMGWCNADAAFTDQPINEIASILFVGNYALRGDVVVGTKKELG